MTDGTAEEQAKWTAASQRAQLGVMMSAAIRLLDDVPDQLFTNLDARDAVVWLMPSFAAEAGPDLTARVLGLPWMFVLSEAGDAPLLAALEAQEEPDDPLVRRRGLILLVDANPADVSLPRRSLPVFLLNGRVGSSSTGLAAQVRRLTMLQELRRRSVRQLIVLAGPSADLPLQLDELWADGFRTPVIVVSNAQDVRTRLQVWADATSVANLWFVPRPAAAFADGLISRYLSGRGGSTILRIRGANGEFRSLDVSGTDDPQHPILGRYELVSEDLLLKLGQDDLELEDVQGFFRDPALSWRPYAAGLPWNRAPEAWSRLRSGLRTLDSEGSGANQVFFLQAQSGAGSTTFLRSLAWSAADEGYPTLVAGPAPFTPTALELISFLDRVTGLVSKQSPEDGARPYQTPALVVFDGHWQGREDEFPRFAREFERSGRRACFLVAVGPYVPLIARGDARFTQIAELSHEVSAEQSADLGRHLNIYLRHHGRTRSDSEWRRFFEASSVQANYGIASFWIALSFWLQRQIDMQETVQAWVYRQFKEHVPDLELRTAVVRIAAFSTERSPLPDAMLPPGRDWPVSERLADLQRPAGALGLLRISGERERYWALIHDVLGRFILTALFYDHETREALGLGDAQNPEHLRFLVLRQLSCMPVLERPELREIADAFAVSMFKIDPGNGHSAFIPYWRDVLAALDAMPRSLRATSRTFLHHSAISRRRVAKDTEAFRLSSDERSALLVRAISDIEVALSITYEPGGEADLMLLNSLAHAAHDLAAVEKANGVGAGRVDELRAKARDASRRAYRLDPDGSFAIETYARTLLSDAESDPDLAAGNAVEVLVLAYGANAHSRSEQRRFALGRLADAAFDILLKTAFDPRGGGKGSAEIDAIVLALRALTDGVIRFHGMDIVDYPLENRVRAAELLALPELLGNPQAVMLRYVLACYDQPYDFGRQLELLQSLDAGGARLSPQMQLELALLLHQQDRHHEADRLFRHLRQLWKREEHYVEVPPRLRWLLVPNQQTRRQVHARVSANGEGRYFARVRELQDGEVVFRPQQFGQRDFKPGVTISGFISFGHNGPFLRPMTDD